MKCSCITDHPSCARWPRHAASSAACCFWLYYCFTTALLLRLLLSCFTAVLQYVPVLREVASTRSCLRRLVQHAPEYISLTGSCSAYPSCARGPRRAAASQRRALHHTSAYVSIRRHTSAYVSRRKGRLLELLF
jgi:hypothetical protein